jgi:hypothetical protein
MSVSMKNLRNSKATVFVFALLAVTFTSLNSLHAGVILNLAGIVGGGNGIGNGTAGAGINILDGGNSAPLTGYITAPVNSFVLSANPFVDGVFVPDGVVGVSNASIVVSSTGLTVTNISNGLPSGGSNTWDHFRNGNNNGVTNGFSGPVIGAHANKGITFDLNAMETFHSGQASSYNITAGTGRATTASVDFYLFVDGMLKNSISLNGANQSQNFLGTLNSTDRFLTLITSSRSDFGGDHSLWVNPTVTLSSVAAVPEPSSVVIVMLLGAATFALRFRRKQ